MLPFSSKSLLSKEVHIAFAERRIIRLRDLRIVEVNPLLILRIDILWLLDVANVVARVHGGPEMRHKALQLIESGLVALVLLAHVFCLHHGVAIVAGVIVFVWVVHVAKCPVNSSLDIVVAVLQRLAALLLRQAHHSHLVDELLWDITTTASTSRLLFLDFERLIQCRVLLVGEVPGYGSVRVIISCVVKGMLGMLLGQAHLLEHAEQASVELGLHLLFDVHTLRKSLLSLC